MTMVDPDNIDFELYFKNGQTVPLDLVLALEKALKATSKPNYYAIMPPQIRYNKTLSYFEKVLFAEIGALATSSGYCYADSNYFCDIFSISENTVNKSIAHLEELGFISVAKNKERGSKSVNKIHINPDALDKNKEDVGIDEVFNDDPKNKEVETKSDLKRILYTTPIVYNTNTIDTNTNTIGDSSIGDSHTAILLRNIGEDAKKSSDKALPNWMGKTSYAKMVKTWEMMFEYRFGVKPRSIMPSSAESAAVKRLLETYSEQFAALIIVVHFEWKGINGNDQNIQRRIENAGYPMTWIPRNAPLYFAFIREKMGVKTNDEAVDKFAEVLTNLQEV